MKLDQRQCSRDAQALAPWAADALLKDVPGWTAANGIIHRDYRFAGYRATIALVNAVAAIAEEQDHHPEMIVGYNTCRVSFSTHSAGGALTENDFICAAKIDAMAAQESGA